MAGIRRSDIFSSTNYRLVRCPHFSLSQATLSRIMTQLWCQNDIYVSLYRHNYLINTLYRYTTALISRSSHKIYEVKMTYCSMLSAMQRTVQGYTIISNYQRTVIKITQLNTNTFIRTDYLYGKVLSKIVSPRSPLYSWFNFKIPTWTSNQIPCRVWDEITCPFPNFNGETVEVWEWINNFIPHITMDVIIYPCWDR